MARIKAFNAMIPDKNWYRQLLGDGEGSKEQIGLLKKLLEPQGDECQQNKKLQKHLHLLETLVGTGLYTLDRIPGIYIYERESNSGSQFGLWCLTSLKDAEEGKILKHENTLSAHEQKLQKYRKEVGLEATPVLLTYQKESEICFLMEKYVKYAAAPELDFSYKGSHHRLWSIKDNSRISDFQKAFEKLDCVYLADGHHRLAAAAAIDKTVPQWITTLYIPARQLTCSAFHRMVLPRNYFSERSLLTAVDSCFTRSHSPDNLPIAPMTRHVLGLFYKGQWYKLDLKDEISRHNNELDVNILQERILLPVFGIIDPRTDPQLISWPANQWNEMIQKSSNHPEAVLFTMHAPSIDQLIVQAEKHAVLPPKSTYTEPKVPYGLLLYHNNTKKNMKGILNA